MFFFSLTLTTFVFFCESGLEWTKVCFCFPRIFILLFFSVFFFLFLFPTSSFSHPHVTGLYTDISQSNKMMFTRYHHNFSKSLTLHSSSICQNFSFRCWGISVCLSKTSVSPDEYFRLKRKYTDRVKWAVTASPRQCGEPLPKSDVLANMNNEQRTLLSMLTTYWH